MGSPSPWRRRLVSRKRVNWPERLLRQGRGTYSIQVYYDYYTYLVYLGPLTNCR